MSQNKALRVVLATSNAGKVRELADPLTQFGVEVVGLRPILKSAKLKKTEPPLKKTRSSRRALWRPLLALLVWPTIQVWR